MTMARPHFELRVTKYDPANRNEAGHYLEDEWIMFRQVEEGAVSMPDYLRVETAYVNAATRLLREDGVTRLLLCDVENARGTLPPPPAVSVDDLPDVLRCMLREQYWARLQSGIAFVHIGWDYYMYIGVNSLRMETVADIEATGLFVEPLLSPYFPQEEDT